MKPVAFYPLSLGICAALLIALAACSSTGPGLNSAPRTYPPSSTKDVLILPNATDLSVDSISTINVKVYSFRTNAKPEEVRDYYKETLVKDGWKDETISTAPYHSGFVWTEPDVRAVFGIDIDISPSSADGKTDVKIKLTADSE